MLMRHLLISGSEETSNIIKKLNVKDCLPTGSYVVNR